MRIVISLSYGACDCDLVLMMIGEKNWTWVVGGRENGHCCVKGLTNSFVVSSIIDDDDGNAYKKLQPLICIFVGA